jgi:hypothetical protein
VTGTTQRSRAGDVLFGVHGSIAGTTYGSIVVMATLAAGAGPELSAWRLAVIVATSVVVLWIAHVYSHGLAESIETGHRLDSRELAAVMRRELAIPLAAVGPVAALVLGALGVLRESTAGWLAVGIGLATLGVQGVRYARVERLGRLGTLVAVALNLAIGLVIVALKALVAH